MNNNYPIPIETNAKSIEQYYVVFSINNNKYAINIGSVAEIINIPAIDIPQKSPEGIIGMFNYNGIVIKAVDLCPFLGFSTPSFSIHNRMIIVNSNDEYFAVHTETIENIVKFDEDKIQNLPFSIENSILDKIYKSDDRTINIIDCNVLYELISRENLKQSETDYSKLFPSGEKDMEILNMRAKQHIVDNNAFVFPVHSNAEKQYILFVMDNQNYYLDIKYVKEFISLKHLNITKLPYTPSYITGIVSVKGEFLLVINLKQFIYSDNKNEVKGGKLIITEGKNFNIALLVDDIKYIRNLNSIKKSKMYASSQYYIYSEFMENDELYNILNYEKIINDERLYINIE